MTYRGHIQRGAVVLDEQADLPDGTPVSVRALEANSASVPGATQAVLGVAGTWRGEPDELDRLLEELRREKWAEVEVERRRAP